MMRTCKRFAVGYATGAAAVASFGAAIPQCALAADDSGALQEIVVTSTRLREDISALPLSVTIFDPELIETHIGFDSNVFTALAKLLPGATLSDSVGDPPRMRGRFPLIKVNNVPINSRNLGGDDRQSVNSLPPGLFEGIEVIRGADATYGTEGSAGGVINFRTVRAAPHSAPTLRLSSDVSYFPGSSGVSRETYKVRGVLKGSTERFDYAAGLGVGLFGTEFDAHGNPIGENRGWPFRNSDAYDFSGAIGFNIGEDQRIETNQVFVRVDSDPRNLANGDGDAATQTPSSVRVVPSGTWSRATERKQYIGDIKYTHADVLGSSLTAVIYASDYEAASIYDDDGIQITAMSKWGAALSLETPLGDSGAAVAWGVDYERTKEDPVAYNYYLPGTAQPNVAAGGVSEYIPGVDSDLVSPFVSLKYPLTDSLSFRSNARYQKATYDVIDLPAGNWFGLTHGGVTGAQLDYDDVLFGASLLLAVTDTSEAYISYTEAIDITAPGRATTTGVTASVGTGIPFDASLLKLEPQSVSQFEIGWRGRLDRLRAEVSVFYSDSDSGVDYVAVSSNPPIYELVRDPRRIWGFELDWDFEATQAVTIGGTVGLSDGERDEPELGTIAISQWYVTPLTVTAYLQVNPLPDLQLTLSGMHRIATGARQQNTSPFDGRAPLSEITLFDFSARYMLGNGAIRLAVENVFNDDSLDSRQMFDYSYQLAYPGRRVLLGYTHEFAL